MQVKVQLNNLRSTPRKSRQVVDLIRNKNVAEARALLEFTVKRGADPVLKLLNSAVATAVNDLKLEESNLRILSVTADEGPKLKRSFPMSRGRAYPILKRTSHITLILTEIKPTDSQKPAKTETKKETKPSEKKEVKAEKAPKVSKAKKTSKK